MSLIATTFGGHRVVETLDGEHVSHSVNSPSSANAGVRINSDGTVDKREGGTYTQIDSPDWNGSSAFLSGSDFEVRLTNKTGVPPVGTLGTWLSLSSNQEWFNNRSGAGTNASTNTVEIRRAGYPQIIARRSYNFTATVI